MIICHKLWGFKDWHFGNYRVSGDLIRLTNSSKLVERSLFAITDLLQVAKTIVLYFGKVQNRESTIWLVKIFIEKISNFRKNFQFILFHLIFYVAYVITAP